MEGPKPFNVEESLAPQESIAAPPEATDSKEGNPLPSERELMTYGQKLAQAMDEGGVHPVLIFGSTFSGKSAMLASLLGFLRTNNLGMDATLVPSLLEGESGYARAVSINAQIFFNTIVREFKDGRAPVATKHNLPFFIPVQEVWQQGTDANVTPARVALMESNGESYVPEFDSPRFYKSLTADIESFLRVYEKSISVIYVAPVKLAAVRDGAPVDVRRERDGIRIAEHAIVGAIAGYRKNRAHPELDRHLLLASKWDAYTSPSKHSWTVDEILRGTTAADDVIPFLRDRYREAFNAFNAHVSATQRRVHQYCAGVITALDVDNARNERLRALLDDYSFDLWNWIHTNAVGQAIPAPPAKKPTFSERLSAFIHRATN